ncbi:MAG: DUF1232 domain-containing protein [Draconibacterium sp.]|nr:DUF1232 domain-containing protein [Draconibacterium sp.]
MDKKFSKHYSETGLWEKIKKVSKAAGTKVVYAALLLYYAMQDKSMSVKTRLSIAAALGYFILPTDAIFDLTPIIGFSDDLGVLLFVLSQISASITPEVKDKAKLKIEDWFGEINDEEIQEIENDIF